MLLAPSPSGVFSLCVMIVRNLACTALIFSSLVRAAPRSPRGVRSLLDCDCFVGRAAAWSCAAGLGGGGL